MPAPLLQNHGRYEFSAIPDRPVFDWPGDAPIAFYVGVNLEVFSFGEGAGPELGGPKGSPDVMNFAWRDYGNRVGVWRLLDILDELEIPAVALANGEILEQAPGVVEAFRERGGEVVAHGRTNAEKPGSFAPRDEARLIAEVTESLTVKSNGDGEDRPLGWLAPHISESQAAPDLLAAAGYEYLLDWAMDDQSVWINVGGEGDGGRGVDGCLLPVPYPQELNDLPQVVHRGVTGRQFPEDPVSGVTVAARFREVAPRAGVVPLPGLGHHPQSESPGRTLAAFHAFHDSIGTPRNATRRR